MSAMAMSAFVSFGEAFERVQKVWCDSDENSDVEACYHWNHWCCSSRAFAGVVVAVESRMQSIIVLISVTRMVSAPNVSESMKTASCFVRSGVLVVR